MKPSCESSESKLLFESIHPDSSIDPATNIKLANETKQKMERLNTMDDSNNLSKSPTPNATKTTTTSITATSSTNLNSIKSKKFQKHTRKLLEIALEMLLKSPVPSVQYISLTTINRIFDIYVYHNLFYPGYYESCYVPLAKRQLNQIEMQQKLQNDSFLQLDAFAQQKLTSINSKIVSIDEFCSCLQPLLNTRTSSHFQQQKQLNPATNSYYTNRFSGRELNSTIKEDPSDEINEENLLVSPSHSGQQTSSSPVGLAQMDEEKAVNSVSPRVPRGVLTKTMSISHMAHRIGGFLMRKLSTNHSSCDLNQTGQQQQPLLDYQMCFHCNKRLANEPTADLASTPAHQVSKTHRFKNSVKKAIIQQKRNKFKNETSNLIQVDTDEHPNDMNETVLSQMILPEMNSAKKQLDSESNIANSEIEQQQQQPIVDFTTSILVASKNITSESTSSSILLNRTESNQSLDDEALINPTNINNKNENSTGSTKKGTATSSSSYQNQPFKCLANSIDPKFLLTIIKDRLESHKSVDINATTMNMNTNQAQVNSGSGGVSEAGCSSTNNTKAKCIPSARVIACQHHCVAILAARLFAILCNEKGFQRRIFNENQEICFNLVNDLLYPNNDPVSFIGLNFLLFLI